MAKNKQRIDSWLKFKFNLRVRIGLYKRLKAFTEESFPVYESLLKFKTRYDKKRDFRGKIIGAWLENMKHGSNFHQSIKGWVPESELNLIAAGEDGSTLEEGLGEAIKFAESSEKIKKTIISGAAYPLVLILMVLGFVAMFDLRLAPTYLEILPLERWPSFGYYFYKFSDALVSYWYIALAIIGGVGFMIGSTISTWSGRTREYFDKLPPWSIYKVYQSSAFLISLASMMKSGVPLNEALKRIKKTTSDWVGYYIDEMLKNMRRGGTQFGKHLDVGMLDEETAGDVIDYSDLGLFQEAVYKIGEKNLQESVERIEKRMGIVRNIMIVIVGLTVALIYGTTIELSTLTASEASNSTSMVTKPSPLKK